MEFRIADTFTDSLAKLTGDEQKAIKTTAFDLQMNLAHPGMQFHKIDKARDPNFWSIRVNRDIRLIVHKTEASLLLCYVAHHDPAYHWALRRKLSTHPKTGAAQWVEVRETVKEIIVPKYVEVAQPTQQKPLLFCDISENDLLAYGVPSEWLEDVRGADEDSILVLAEHLPSEAAEALLDLATGVTPKATQTFDAALNPFDHPDAQRRFRVMNNIEELERALEFPWEKWAVFLHPTQRQFAEGDFNGPARVSGSAGTGKTIVALHRAVFLARKYPDARVLLTTFSETLSHTLHSKLRTLISNQPRIAERLEVQDMNALGQRLYKLNFSPPQMASSEVIAAYLREAAATQEAQRFSAYFLMTEWLEVVDAWQIRTWEAYRDVKRLGRKVRLPEQGRKVLWSIFEGLRDRLNRRSLITSSDLFSRLTEHLKGRTHLPFDSVVVDESQDISVAQLRFLSVLGRDHSNGLFFAGDLGQRIFQPPFSWKAQGVDIRGRSRTLRINYRTSHQIRQQADRLLAPELSDVDGNTEERRGTVSVFNGPSPTIRVFETSEAEIEAVRQWLIERRNEGVVPQEIGVFVRSATELSRAKLAVDRAELSYKVLDEKLEPMEGQVSISTMHLAKGLEFRAVIVMACDDDVIPLQERIESVADDADLEEVYNTERHLLYVACTRARDYLIVTGVSPASEFLDDLGV